MELFYALNLLGLFYFTSHRLYRYLRYFQQEEYDAKRFLSWLFMQRACDLKGSLIACTSAAFTYLFSFTWWQTILSAGTLIALSYFEEDPRKQGKIRLKMTERAERIYRAAFILFVLTSLCATMGAYLIQSAFLFWMGQVVVIQMTPLYLIGGNLLLQRGEKRRQDQFLQEAKTKLAEIKPFVIGITGSYGKTSTKDALSQILQISLAPTFWPSKGINTPMGITREIRENLQSVHKYAVVEMGAYGIGSIKRLCDLTPPNAALITTIGAAHLERFGSLENIRRAKSELAQAVPFEGILICNGDDPGARQIAKEHPKKTTLFYGFDSTLGPLDCIVQAWQVVSNGTQFQLKYKQKIYDGFTPLFGKNALSNCIGAFLMATELGANPEFALAVISNLEPVSNRLQVQKDGQITYLHDAYNSNPQGFMCALDVLQAVPSSRKILMTPGMIELGNRQNLENNRLARRAAELCDIAIVVGATNRQSLLEGLLMGGMKEENIHVTDTRDQAFNRLADLRKDGDAILIENDLSDLYEAPARF